MEADDHTEKVGRNRGELEPLPRHEADLRFAQLLVSGEVQSWDKFYKKVRNNLQDFVHAKYPDVFTDVAIEEICDGVQSRLTQNDCRVLRQYRGDCKLATYITRQAEWAIKDWLRKHSEELMNEPLSGGEQEEGYACEGTREDLGSGVSEGAIPEPVKELSDELRWAFLLRYYDYFGFPLDEVRLLAKSRGVPIRSVVTSIVDFLESEGKDVLEHQREKSRELRRTIEALCYHIHKLNLQEQKLRGSAQEGLTADGLHADQIDKKLDVVRSTRLKLENRRKTLINNKSSVAIVTPYEIVGEILGESNLSTVRSRVFLAKKQLAERLKKEAAKQFT